MLHITGVTSPFHTHTMADELLDYFRVQCLAQGHRSVDVPTPIKTTHHQPFLVTGVWQHTALIQRLFKPERNVLNPQAAGYQTPALNEEIDFRVLLWCLSSPRIDMFFLYRHLYIDMRHAVKRVPTLQPEPHLCQVEAPDW